MKMDEKMDLLILKEKVDRDYRDLPDVFKRKVDELCPPVREFATEYDEKEWLKRRSSVLSSLWAGMYCGVGIIISSIVWLPWLVVKILFYIMGSAE